MKTHNLIFEYGETYNEENMPPEDERLFISEDGDFWFYGFFRNNGFYGFPMFCENEDGEEIPVSAPYFEPIYFWAFPPSIKKE